MIVPMRYYMVSQISKGISTYINTLGKNNKHIIMGLREQIRTLHKQDTPSLKLLYKRWCR